ncbi:MAG: hypothetical protein ACRD4B_08725, partial [Acidobacteriota bacterium]
ELLTAALGLEQDRHAIWSAVACCLNDLVVQDRIVGYTLGGQPSLGPEGGCVGSELEFSVWLAACSCPG